ncbi:hypothetical protein L596_021850 [Steinernema carpocapsae]|uniref:PDZ domain-containing protein n=1 Tax=Steinernema carpocapsae TaxID=34508 RepID=A0A4U5MJZ5_STECR|nr:hypothetical protein L596_021850 [Steinernema carpocapsae]
MRSKLVLDKRTHFSTKTRHPKPSKSGPRAPRLTFRIWTLCDQSLPCLLRLQCTFRLPFRSRGRSAPPVTGELPDAAPEAGVARRSASAHGTPGLLRSFAPFALLPDVAALRCALLRDSEYPRAAPLPGFHAPGDSCQKQKTPDDREASKDFSCPGRPASKDARLHVSRLGTGLSPCMEDLHDDLVVNRELLDYSCWFRESSGLLPGDRILAVAGVPVRNLAALKLFMDTRSNGPFEIQAERFVDPAEEHLQPKTNVQPVGAQIAGVYGKNDLLLLHTVEAEC